jgi:hypothetical protein
MNSPDLFESEYLCFDITDVKQAEHNLHKFIDMVKLLVKDLKNSENKFNWDRIIQKRNSLKRINKIDKSKSFMDKIMYPKLEERQ